MYLVSGGVTGPSNCQTRASGCVSTELERAVNGVRYSEIGRCVDGRLVIRASTRHPEPVTLRPTIRPGAPLLRRDATHLQVGTSPGIVIDDRPGLRSFLRFLDGVRDVERLRVLARTDVPELEADVDDVLGRCSPVVPWSTPACCASVEHDSGSPCTTMPAADPWLAPSVTCWPISASTPSTRPTPTCSSSSAAASRHEPCSTRPGCTASATCRWSSTRNGSASGRWSSPASRHA